MSAGYPTGSAPNTSSASLIYYKIPAAAAPNYCGITSILNYNTLSSRTSNIFGLLLAPNIDQSAVGTTGISRGIMVSPTLTSVKDWRSIEFDNTVGWGLYGVGTAKNYLAGNLSIGSTAAAEMLDVTGNIKLSGALKPAGNAGTTGQVLTSRGNNAAPEWQTIAAGATSNVVENLAALKALPLTAGLPQNKLVVMRNYDAIDDGLGGVFEWVELQTIPTAIPFTLSGSVFVRSDDAGARGFWKRQIYDGTVNAGWMGVKPGQANQATNGSRFNDAIITAKFLQNQSNWAYTPSTTNRESAYKIYVPGNREPYYFGQTIVINDMFEIYGDEASGNQTIILMTTAVTGAGIKIEKKVTGSSDFTVRLKNFILSYNNPSANFYIPTTGTVHGIYAKEAIYAENVTVCSFPADGFHIEGVPHVNSADFTSLLNCTANFNAKSGFFVGGALVGSAENPDTEEYGLGDEAQVCNFTHCISRLNGTWGFYDYCGLGNTYTNCSAHSNSQRAAITSTNDLRRGGGFKVKGDVNVTRLVGCYSEGDNMGNESNQATIVLGGTYGSPTADGSEPAWRVGFSPAAIGTNQGRVAMSPGFEVRSYDRTGDPYEIIGITRQQGLGTHGLGLKANDELGGSTYTLNETNHLGREVAKPANSVIAFQRNNGEFVTSFLIAQAGTSKQHFGLPNATGSNANLNEAGRIAFPMGISLKDYNNYQVQDADGHEVQQYRALLMAKNSPTEAISNREGGYYNRESGVGDFVLNTNPAKPDVIGWRCTVAGQPGTWVELSAGSGALTARNGISNNAGFLELGGDLTKPTTIAISDVNTLNFTNSAAANIIGFKNHSVRGGIISLNDANFIVDGGTADHPSFYIGKNAGNLVYNPINNIGLGASALAGVTGGGANVAIGNYTLAAATTAFANIAIGQEVLKSNTGSGNVAIGSTAMTGAGAAEQNVAIGWEAMQNSTGNSNAVIGRQAMPISSGGANSALGAFTLTSVASGNFNNAIGAFAGASLTAGDHNLFIGGGAGPATPGSFSNKLFINSGAASNVPLIGGDFANRYVSINRNYTSINNRYTLDVNGTGKFVGAVTIGTDALTDAVFDNATSAANGYKLLVKGKVLAEEVVIKLFQDWPDYVFDKDYKLLPLRDVKAFIDQFGHLPNVASAKEIASKEGVAMGEMQRKLLEKIEELTIYAIDADKKNDAANEKLKLLEERLLQLEQLIKKLNQSKP